MIPRDHIPWTALPVLKNPQKGFNHLTMKNAAFQAPEFPYVLYNNSKKKALIKKVKSCGPSFKMPHSFLALDIMVPVFKMLFLIEVMVLKNAKTNSLDNKALSSISS